MKKLIYFKMQNNLLKSINIINQYYSFLFGIIESFNSTPLI